MLAALTSKLKGIGQGALSRLGGSGDFASDAIGLGMKAMAHPVMAGAGLGAASGFMASGDLGGALTGAAFGAAGGGAGWGTYRQSVGRNKGPGGLFNQFSRARQRAGSKLGAAVSSNLPDVASAYGPTFKSPRSGAQRMMEGHTRNLGGKRVGAAGVGAGMMLASGAIGGMGYNMGGALASGMGNTFGGQVSSMYGNAFSGMGNGTITGY